jgi:FlaA1/EpsC-like NDP-sugar epimerase
VLVNTLKKPLLNLPRSVKRGVVMSLDILFCGLSIWLAFGLRLDYWGFFDSKQWLAFIVALGISFPLFVVFGLYRAIFRYVGAAVFASMSRVFFIYSGIYFFVFTVIGLDDIPRSIGVIQPILLFIGIGVSRYLMRFWLGGVGYAKNHSDRVKPIALIYGAGSAGRQLAAALSINNEILVKGFIDDNKHLQFNTINGISVYPNLELQRIISRFGVTDVLLAIPSAKQVRRNEIIAALNGCGVRVRTLPGLLDMAAGRVKMSDLHDLDMNDLLGRPVVPPDIALLEKNICGKSVLVTGAGGSIGSELCRQIIKFSPKSLVLVDNSEHALYLIKQELIKLMSNYVRDLDMGVEGFMSSAINTKESPIKLIPRLVSVRDKDSMLKLFTEYRPSTVYHAAAYKHVPLVEQNPAEGIRNNVFGTLACAKIALETGVSNFILISTDKAVRPTNVMGASKRIAELVLQAMSEVAAKDGCHTKFSMVRFGNVLGSSGSVAPLFSSQIKAGGPITLTHPDVTRYFMTIPEAAQLVIQSGAMANGGDVFVLDMGKPVRIYDLAIKMVYLSGLIVKDELNPFGDIEIKVIGLRPGEKLYEELLIGDNPRPTDHPKIMMAHEDFLSWDHLEQELEKLIEAIKASDAESMHSIIKKLVIGYQPHRNSEVSSEETF